MQCGMYLAALWVTLTIQYGVLFSQAITPRPAGYLDFDNLPETNFTCEGKVIGGYYADIETGCQMFHVCTIGQRGDMTDIKFLCLNGTVFEQETRVCERVDEVDCSRSKDFYDLNLELYNNGFILPENEEPGDKSHKNEQSDDKSQESEEEELGDEEEEEEAYDESYEAETEGPPATSRPSSTSTTTSTTTTPKPPVYTPKPTFSIVLPNLKNKNTGTHLTGVVSVPSSHQHGYQPLQHGGHDTHDEHSALSFDNARLPSSSPTKQTLENKNVGTHLTGVVHHVHTAPSGPTQRPYGTTGGYEAPYNPKPITLETGLKPPPTVYKTYGVPTSTFKPAVYDPYKTHYFSTTSPKPAPSGHSGPPLVLKPQGFQEPRPPPATMKPVVVLSHHFPSKHIYDDFTSFGPTAISNQHLRHNNRPNVHLKIQHPGNQHSHPYFSAHASTHKLNPTILALQSQQKKVHQLHQEGLEMAEHQIAQVATRNAEISNLQSQQEEDLYSRKDELDSQENPVHRETKEIPSFSKPEIAIVTSTSSTSSRVEKQPITSFVKTVTNEKGKAISHTVYKPDTGGDFKTELEKLFSSGDVKTEDKSDMDLEQLLLAWKLKTNQEVTKGDIEKVFSKLDTSKFKHGETISLSDIFSAMNDSLSVGESTRTPPVSYDDYTEEDVQLDPFYKDVPKVRHRVTRDLTLNVSDNGKFNSRESSRRGRGRQQDNSSIVVADITLLHEDTEQTPTQSPRRPQRGRGRPRTTTTTNSAIVSQVELTTQSGNPRNRNKVKYSGAENGAWLATSTARPYPETGFSCRGKVAGGFYADTEVDCQLFHICSEAGNGMLTDNKFFCGEDTRFNQRSRTCQAKDVVECSLSTRYYHLNDNFRIPEPEADIPELQFEPAKIHH